jgi:hypothetical protein
MPVLSGLLGDEGAAAVFLAAASAAAPAGPGAGAAAMPFYRSMAQALPASIKVSCDCSYRYMQIVVAVSHYRIVILSLLGYTMAEVLPACMEVGSFNSWGEGWCHGTTLQDFVWGIV